MDITFSHESKITPGQFVDLLRRSGLAERRPVEDSACVEAMLQNADLLISAWQGDHLVGVARSVTDFSYCCYLSDLAVDASLQRRGIGKRLIHETQQRLGPRCKIILLAAPAATEYYSHIGFSHHPQAWVLARDVPVSKRIVR